MSSVSGGCGAAGGVAKHGTIVASTLVSLGLNSQMQGRLLCSRLGALKEGSRRSKTPEGDAELLQKSWPQVQMVTIPRHSRVRSPHFSNVKKRLERAISAGRPNLIPRGKHQSSRQASSPASGDPRIRHPPTTGRAARKSLRGAGFHNAAWTLVLRDDTQVRRVAPKLRKEETAGGKYPGGTIRRRRYDG